MITFHHLHHYFKNRAEQSKGSLGLRQDTYVSPARLHQHYWHRANASRCPSSGGAGAFLSGRWGRWEGEQDGRRADEGQSLLGMPLEESEETKGNIFLTGMQSICGTPCHKTLWWHLASILLKGNWADLQRKIHHKLQVMTTVCHLWVSQRAYF